MDAPPVAFTLGNQGLPALAEFIHTEPGRYRKAGAILEIKHLLVIHRCLYKLIDTVEVDGGSRESVVCLAIFAGQYLMGGTTYPFWLPSTSIQDDETGITAARRLALDMLDEMSHFLVNALVRPTGLVFASSWDGSITSSVYPVNISLFNMHLSADVDRLGIITAVQQTCHVGIRTMAPSTGMVLLIVAQASAYINVALPVSFLQR